jgi:hypothetical protein
MNWSAYGERQQDGRVYGQKDRQFAPFFSLPGVVDAPMEIAVSATDSVRRQLVSAGWRLADPLAVTCDPWTFQQYIRASRAEFSVAKHAYVVTRSGWFSDRSCGYLAMGRPVLLEDTGFSDFLPCGSGLLPFRTPEEAVAAIRRLTEENYADHCRAARTIAEEYFDAHRVLTELLEQSL